MTLFFFNDTATTEIYTLSLHDALPICFHRAGTVDLVDPSSRGREPFSRRPGRGTMESLPNPRSREAAMAGDPSGIPRSEEHTSELQSRQYLVCRLLLEKKNTPCIFLQL